MVNAQSLEAPLGFPQGIAVIVNRKRPEEVTTRKNRLIYRLAQTLLAVAESTDLLSQTRATDRTKGCSSHELREREKVIEGKDKRRRISRLFEADRWISLAKENVMLGYDEGGQSASRNEGRYSRGCGDLRENLRKDMLFDSSYR